MIKLVFAADHSQLLLEQGVKRVGSAPDSDIVLRGEGILPQHAELHVTANGVMLKVLRDAPTTVNQRPVDGLISLRPDDVIGFGPVTASIVAMETTQAGARTATPVIDDVGTTTVRAALPKYALRAQNGRMLGRTFPLTGATVIGRSAECQLRVEDSSLSRKHAKLIPTNEGVVVEDLGSTNGSFVNGTRVQRTVAKAGDEIGFDTLRFKLFELGQEGMGTSEAAAAGKSPAPWIWVVAAVVVIAVVLVVLL